MVRAGDNTDGHGFDNPLPRVPSVQGGKAIRAHKKNEVCCTIAGFQRGQAVNRIGAGDAQFPVFYDDTRVGGEGFTGGYPRGIVMGRRRFQRVLRADQPPYFIQSKGGKGTMRQVDMSLVGRVE